MAAKKPVSDDFDPFGAATSTTATGKKPKSAVILASAVLDPDSGKTIHSEEEVREALENYTKGCKLAKEAESLCEGARQTIVDFGEINYARQWVDSKVRPATPRLYSDKQGTAVVQFIITDREMKLDDTQFASLSNLVGPEVADELVEKRDEFTLDYTVMEKEVQFDNDNIPVREVLRRLLVESVKRGVPKEVVTSLFLKKPVFKTKKGIIDRAIELVGDSVSRIQQYLQIGRFPIVLKATGKAEE